MFTIYGIFCVRENDGQYRAFTASGQDLGTFRNLAEMKDLV